MFIDLFMNLYHNPEWEVVNHLLFTITETVILELKSAKTWC
jgi:hypothetical protein